MAVRPITSMEVSASRRRGVRTPIIACRGSCGCGLMHRSERAALGCPGPGHKFVDARGGPQIDNLGQHVGEVACGSTTRSLQVSMSEAMRAQFSGVLRSLIVAREQ